MCFSFVCDHLSVASFVTEWLLGEKNKKRRRQMLVFFSGDWMASISNGGPRCHKRGDGAMARQWHSGSATSRCREAARTAVSLFHEDRDSGLGWTKSMDYKTNARIRHSVIRQNRIPPVNCRVAKAMRGSSNPFAVISAVSEQSANDAPVRLAACDSSAAITATLSSLAELCSWPIKASTVFSMGDIGQLHMYVQIRWYQHVTCKLKLMRLDLIGQLRGCKWPARDCPSPSGTLSD